MMKKICLLILMASCCDVYGDSSASLNIHGELDTAARATAELEAHVQAALDHFENKAPKFHRDCLRVWKNFRNGINPHYSYRSWGYNFILWLKEHRNVTFKSQSQVGDVFAILYKKGLISKHAVLVLTANAWSYLVYREGIPDIEKAAPARRSKQEVDVIT